MPASTLDPVNAALRTALSKNESAENNLDQQLAGSTKKALLSNIEFESAGSYQNTVLDRLKSKYIVLRSPETPPPSKPEDDMNSDETLKLAKYELFPLNAVQLGWNNCDWSVGAGMFNMGNTCYLNSTLQALFHVPALVNWLMSDKEHTTICQESGGMCIICAMRKTLQDSQQRNANSIRPLLIYNKLRLVCRNLIPGRQEDAHEFLRYLVEAMEKAYLSRFKNNSDFDSKVKETTPLNQILGGYLRSAVRCLKCGHVSTTFQHFQDLLLDIRKAQTLDEALELYFSREKLDDESYQCESCQKKVPATKQFSIERTPMVLCIQLKRFSVSNNKITKHLNFRQRLDLTKYARHRPNVPLIYRLVALVTHMGPTVSCGHYTAVAQAPNGNFFQFDDSMVRPISHQAVFNTNAYIMLYELESSPYSQKSTASTILVSKMKTPSLSTETNPVACSSNSSSASSSSALKSFPNGIGFTSDKVYGPELPPDRVESSRNGYVTSSNGKGESDSSHSSSSSEHDSDGDQAVKKPSVSDNSHSVSKSDVAKDKDSDISSTCEQSKSPVSLKKTSSPSSSPNVSTSISSLSSPEITPNKDPTLSPVSSSKQKNKENSPLKLSPIAKPLVPYESDDTCSSEDSNQSPNEMASRVSTKAAIGDWQVTSSTDVKQELSKGTSWKNKKEEGQGNKVVSELFRMSHSGYSAPVSTWNGSRSELDKEVQNERREDRKRNLPDSSDQGRTKHIKLGSNFKLNPGYNPIQEYHNAKNWNPSNGSGGNYKPFYNGNRHRRTFHHKNFHKNYRYRQ
ncbi:ubiquitin carboxyl-terminal hydrolase 36 [Diorhabda sublineata]|uniref:ubiquitin carboxyl-terminal hydrolase 36 n=1 Tax=Diorhabda sublineata TaxID=1163346 RepID=UPI0024E063AB|nr:ubiquitin carboxyl-terminal hydrolase 36 [Diorhabda sublineata]